MITLSQGQKQAADAFLQFMLDPSVNEMVISGFAGTGKSTLTRYILDNLHSQMSLVNLINGYDVESNGLTVHITATTNKAARVVSELSGYANPVTIHSLLGLTIRNDYKTGKQILDRKNAKTIHDSLIIIDEASFIDRQLLDYIRKGTVNSKILYIGDPYQLAPTYENACPIFEQGIFEANLTQVLRNQGAIEQAAEEFRKMVYNVQYNPEVPIDGSKILHVDGPTFQAMIDKEFTLRSHIPDHAKVLAWTNNRVHQYNAHIRALHTPEPFFTKGEHVITNKPISLKDQNIPTDGHCEITSDPSPSTRSFPTLWEQDIEGYYVRIDDNSSLHFVPANQKDAQTLMKLAAKQKDWVTYFNIKDTWLDLRPVHASTVHKSQGSTYEKAFIDLSDIGRCNITSDVARMLYVALSRASQQVILYGNLPVKYGTLKDGRHTAAA